MGDPKKLKKKYARPRHPWSHVAIETEAKLMQEYGLNKKKEIYVASTFLKKYKDIAKRLIAKKTAQGEKEKKQVLEKLQRLGLLHAGSDLDQILALETKDVLERRLESIIYRKSLARSMKQARQFIIHRHIQIVGKEITSPSTLLTKEQEAQITFKTNSTLANESHPERTIITKEIKEEVENLKQQRKELRKKRLPERTRRTHATNKTKN